VSAVTPLDASTLRRLAGAAPLVRELVVLETTGSTNDDALRLADSGAPEGTVVVASRQTAGRGRLGRPWHSSGDGGLYLSIVLRPAGPVESLTRWTVASALAACEACREASGAAIEIKWPNDLIFGGRKVAGTLAELRSAAGVATALVLGTGFNVNQQAEDFPAELCDRAVSLRMARGGELRSKLSREHLAADYLSRMGRIVELLRRGAWPEITRAWLALAPDAVGRSVLVSTGGAGAAGERVPGITRGLDESGALLVERSDGETMHVTMSEAVTTRGDR
jgi:BirA family biotin operon repressor/biotin-[acetyl-CoA-carboxylase] ligase